MGGKTTKETMEEGVFKKEFIDEIKRREKDHRLIPAEKVFKKLW